MLEAIGIVFILMSSVGVSYLLMLSFFKLIHMLQERVGTPVRQ